MGIMLVVGVVLVVLMVMVVEDVGQNFRESWSHDRRHWMNMIVHSGRLSGCPPFATFAAALFA